MDAIVLSQAVDMSQFLFNHNVGLPEYFLSLTDNVFHPVDCAVLFRWQEEVAVVDQELVQVQFVSEKLAGYFLDVFLERGNGIFLACLWLDSD